MPRFFINSSDIFDSSESVSGKCAFVSGEDANHILKVLRTRVGEGMVLCDENGTEYSAVFIRAENKDKCVFEIKSEKPSENEPPYKAVIYQAQVKGDRFDTVVMKGTELGAYSFIPFSSERCVMKFDASEAEKKIARWQRIASEAAKQCGRGRIPQVENPTTFRQAIENAEGLLLFCYEGEGTESIKKILGNLDSMPETVSVFIGPEGGFSTEEVEFAVAHGAKNTGLGKRILRTETASSFVLSCLSAEYEL